MLGKLRKSFSVENVEDYLSSILANKVRLNTLPDLPQLKTIQI